MDYVQPASKLGVSVSLVLIELRPRNFHTDQRLGKAGGRRSADLKRRVGRPDGRPALGCHNPFNRFELRSGEPDDDAEAFKMKKRSGSPDHHSPLPRTEAHGQVMIGEEEEEEEEEEEQEKEKEKEEEDEEEDDDDDEEPLQVKPSVLQRSPTDRVRGL